MNQILGLLGRGLVGLLGDFVAAFGGASVARLLFGESTKPADTHLVEQAAQLSRDGKTDEAESMIHARMSGKGWGDEQIVLTDLLALTFFPADIDEDEDEAIKKILGLANFIAGLSPVSLTPRQRLRFRIGHIHEQKARIRWNNFIALAKLPSDEARKAFILAPGFMDKTTGDRVIDAINWINDRAGKRLATKQVAKSQQATPDPDPVIMPSPVVVQEDNNSVLRVFGTTIGQLPTQKESKLSQLSEALLKRLRSEPVVKTVKMTRRKKFWRVITFRDTFA